jgi:hypothetical protein
MCNHAAQTIHPSQYTQVPHTHGPARQPRSVHEMEAGAPGKGRRISAYLNGISHKIHTSSSMQPWRRPQPLLPQPRRFVTQWKPNQSALQCSHQQHRQKCIRQGATKPWMTVELRRIMDARRSAQSLEAAPSRAVDARSRGCTNSLRLNSRSPPQHETPICKTNKAWTEEYGSHTAYHAQEAQAAGQHDDDQRPP